MPFLWALCGGEHRWTGRGQHPDTCTTGSSQQRRPACCRDRPATRLAAARVHRPASVADRAHSAAATLRGPGHRATGRPVCARGRRAGRVPSLEWQAHGGDRRHRAGADQRRRDRRGGGFPVRDRGALRPALGPGVRSRWSEPSVPWRWPGSATGTGSAGSWSAGSWSAAGPRSAARRATRTAGFRPGPGAIRPLTCGDPVPPLPRLRRSPCSLRGRTLLRLTWLQ